MVSEYKIGVSVSGLLLALIYAAKM